MYRSLVLASCLAGCFEAGVVDELERGIVFTYPVDGQLDVPLGAQLYVSYTDARALDAQCSVVGPDGPIAISQRVVGGGKTVAIQTTAFAPGVTYEIYAGTKTQPLLRFTTRSDRPRSGPPTLIAVNGSEPRSPGSFRPIFETSSLQLVFSEPLDPRSIDGGIELVDIGTGLPVSARVFGDGIHVVLDPLEPLATGASYELRLGGALVDLAGEHVIPTTIPIMPVDSLGRGAIRQLFRTRQKGDPVASVARTDATNVMSVSHPLIGEATAAVLPAVLETELGDPLALDGPIAFAIPRGQRLTSAGLDIVLAGAIPSGLTTGDIWIELVADGGGRLYRNRYRSPDTIPDNETSPLLVDLSFDLAVYASDPIGNGVLAQTVLGVQLTGVAIADDGALAIETLGAIDIGLLGISSAPANIVLDLISDPAAALEPDTRAPALLSTLPAADTRDLAVDDGIELAFDEPIELGGITLYDEVGAVVPSVLELYGSVVVVRPRAALQNDRRYRIELGAVTDAAGNALPPRSLTFGTQTLAQTDVPLSVLAIRPGAPCALVNATQTSAGHCAGGRTGDDTYRPFELAANDDISVVFDQPVRRASVVLGTRCGAGSVRVERVDEQGACAAAMTGTLLVHARDVSFVPDRPWTPGEHYRLRLVAGGNTTCDVGELCGANGRPASFDPLAGMTAAATGGPDLVVDFVATASTTATTLLATASPSADLNGSGRLDAGEPRGDDNRVALRIAGTSGLITSASFQGPDCLPATPGIEACMYMLGAIPAQLGERRENCLLPDGSLAPTCVPVTMSAQAMYATSVTMNAAALGIGLTTETGMSVMRMRERADGPLEGYLVERDGRPVMVAALSLYMDAPDMSLPASQHDMHSKPLAVALEGPLSFLPDGRIAIALRNTADVPISVGIDAPLGITGAVDLIVPKGEMKLQLVSRPLRGALP